MRKIYVSSTYEDLQAYRQQAHRMITERGDQDLSYEQFAPESNRDVNQSLASVDDCALYIGIFAMRYGDVLPGHDKSITELELRRALDQKKDSILLLLARDEFGKWEDQEDAVDDYHKFHALRRELEQLAKQRQGQDGGTKGSYLVELSEVMAASFSPEELKSLSLELDVVFEDLPGEGKAAKVRELTMLFERHDKLDQLVEKVRQERPFKKWPDPPRSIRTIQHDQQLILVREFRNQDELTIGLAEAIREWEKARSLQSRAGDAEWEIYRSRAFEVHQSLSLQTMIETNQSTDIPLHGIFVPQLVQRERPRRDIPDFDQRSKRELYKFKQAADDTDEPGHPTKVPSTIDNTSGSDGPIEFVVDVLGRERSQVILGGTGSGKSTLLHYVLLSLCNARPTEGVLPALQTRPIPFMIELRQYVVDKSNLDFVAYLKQNLSRRYAVEFEIEDMRSLLNERGKTIVFFDALDEIFDPIERTEVIQKLQTFSLSHPQTQIVVTSRIVGYDAHQRELAGFQHYTLLDFYRQQINQFITKWYEYYALGNNERTAAGLLQRIEENPRLLELAGNPLLLTMMAIIYKLQDLPERRWKLYEKCTELLLEQWDVNRKSLERNKVLRLAIEITGSQKAEILQKVARYMIEEGQEGRELNAITFEPLRDVLAVYLRQEYRKSPGDAKALAEGILRHLRERAYILAEVGDGIYGFVHRTFMEYFAACHVKSEFVEQRRSNNEWLKQDIFGRFWQREEWREVLLLLIAMLADEGLAVQEIIDHVWKQTS